MISFRSTIITLVVCSFGFFSAYAQRNYGAYPKQAESSGYSYSSSAGYGDYIPPVKYDLYLVRFTTAKPNPAATEYPYAGGTNFLPVSTVSPTACRSTTYRTPLGCPCKLIGQKCAQGNSICKQAGTGIGDGLCACASGYVAYNASCVTISYYNQTVAPVFTLLAPTIIASCFLPVNTVIGNVPQVGANGSVIYTLTLVSSSPTNVATRYISIESTSGNILFLKAPVLATVSSQTYTVVGKDSTGISSNTVTFTVGYNCTAPNCAFDLGTNFTVDCTRFGVADTIVTALTTNTVAPTTFALTLVSSTSTLGTGFYTIDSTTGQIFLQKEPHGGIFVETYTVIATNAVGQACSGKNVTTIKLYSEESSVQTSPDVAEVLKPRAFLFVPKLICIAGLLFSTVGDYGLQLCFCH